MREDGREYHERFIVDQRILHTRQVHEVRIIQDGKEPDQLGRVHSVPSDWVIECGLVVSLGT